jgi:hypothetical protein
MIELTDYRGNKVLIHTKDIREVRGYFDQRYPSIRSVIILYDGKKIECSNTYDVVKNLTIQRVSGMSLSEYAQKKLEYINGSCIAREFPEHQPSKEWAGAVLDLLEDMKLGDYR